MSITAKERATYEEVWSFPGYGRTSPGEALAKVFMEMSGAQPGDTVLDAGCGAGKGALALDKLGLRVKMCDITDSALLPEVDHLEFRQAVLWNNLKVQTHPFDGGYQWTYCCDVLEHIPPHFTMLVVDQLLRVTIKGLFLSISLGADHFGAVVGAHLHHTVQSFVAWREQLDTIGRVVEARDWLNTGIYLVQPPHAKRLR